MTAKPRTGGEFVCDALAAADASTIFSLSGNQILPVYDAAGDAGIRIVHTRHESAAAYAATAWSEITGATGVVLTSAGPGFLAALQGVAACRSMELPLIFLSGDSSLAEADRGAFQALDQLRIAGSVCKASLAVNSVEDISPMISQAAMLARSGIPGPVHVSLPGDVLADSAILTEQEHKEDNRQLTDEQVSTVEEIARHLVNARRPLILARPSAARDRAGDYLNQIAASLRIEPVIIEAPRGLADLKYASLTASFARSDCALVIASPDFALGYLSKRIVASNGAVLLVSAAGDPESEREVDLHLQGEPALVLQELAGLLVDSDVVDAAWSSLWPIATPPPAGSSGPGKIHPLAITQELRMLTDPGDIFVLDGGEFCQWIRLGLRDVPNTVLWNGKIGAIGGAIPMALGAAIAAEGSQRRVIAIMGDGAAGYFFSEFETMARYGLPIISVIGNDARWAAEWHLQVTRYGAGRTFETELLPARYDRVASGFDAYGEHVTAARDLPGALQEALGRNSASCVNIEIASIPSPAAMS